MRTRLPFLPLLCTMLAWSGPTRAGLAAQDREAAVARTEPASTSTSSHAVATDLSAAELGVRHVISSYGRAIETQDVELFRSLMPGITTDAEKRLRESFRTIKSQRVGMPIDSVDVGGKIATVHISRQDTIDGRRMKPVQQEFHLVLRGDGWRIQSLSAGQ